MAIDYAVLEDGLVVSIASGELTDADVIGHARTLAEDERVSTPLRQAFDMRGVVGLDSLSGYGLRTTAKKKFSDDPEGRCAIVVGSALGTGMARMFSAYAEVQGATVRVFDSMEDALEWLGRRELLGQVQARVEETAGNTP